MRKTKIICTLGPSTDDEKVLRELMLAGMDITRFNFSHGDYEGHKLKFDTVVKLREQLGLPVATMLDTKGPEIRICKFKDSKIMLTKGDTFTLTTRELEGTTEIVSVTYKNLPNDVHVGSAILLDDGLIELNVIEIKDNTDIVCKVINDGALSNNKGVNLPEASLSMPFISKKDREDIIFGAKTGFDFIAASFTRTAEDILEIRKILKEYNGNGIKIIAKIENREGVNNIDEIIRVADGVMVARGDMGVEIPLEEVPALQKMIIKKVYNAGKQVITATQMLDSMMKNPRPTRAETNDVANAIYDGTSAIMLSGETAAGLYPVEALKIMVRIALQTERDIDYVSRFKHRKDVEVQNVTHAISNSTCAAAHDLGAKAIVTVTKSGRTAHMISKYRPTCPIIGCTTSKETYHQLAMTWGVIPVLMEEKENTTDLFETAIEAAEQTGIVSKGDLVVLTGGMPLGVSGTTNIMKVDVVGKILVSGTGLNEKSVNGNVCICHTEEDVKKNFNEGDILVVPQTSNELFPLIKKAAGIITEQSGVNSHAAIVGMALDIPVIVGASNATKILKNGTTVCMDSTRGVVSYMS
ncbi:MAG: pyruvate kinase [Niameybacter sp.]|uniref:pyruvate kinase n=1 Tax=Niameybacter sp. TaxID=2033640 RepID=UPI002FC9394E